MIQQVRENLRKSPNLVVRYNSPQLMLDGDYTLDYMHYNKHDQQTGTWNTVNSRVFIEAVPATVYFEGIHDFRRVSLSVVTDYTQQSPTARQADQSTLTLHPYIVRNMSNEIKERYKICYARQRICAWKAVSRCAA